MQNVHVCEILGNSDNLSSYTLGFMMIKFPFSLLNSTNLSLFVHHYVDILRYKIFFWPTLKKKKKPRKFITLKKIELRKNQFGDGFQEFIDTSVFFLLFLRTF